MGLTSIKYTYHNHLAQPQYDDNKKVIFVRYSSYKVSELSKQVSVNDLNCRFVLQVFKNQPQIA